jgi:hypothetical protein
MSMFRAKALCGEVSGANFSTKGFRSKRQSSPCIFQVIASLPMKALLFIGTIYTGTDSSKFSKFQEKKYHYYYYDLFLYQCFINPRLKPTFINIEFHKHIRPAPDCILCRARGTYSARIFYTLRAFRPKMRAF